jgi:predicted nucleotidyltransferase
MNNLFKVLERVSKFLKGKRIRWAIVGSTTLALQGIEIKPKDIDILTTKEGAYKISSILKEYEIKPVKFRRSKIFSSHFGRFLIDGIKVEVMGGLKGKIGGKWVSLTGRLKRLEKVKVGNIRIPVPRLKDQLEVYSKINRKKNLERVRKIREFLEKKKRIKGKLKK